MSAVGHAAGAAPARNPRPRGGLVRVVRDEPAAARRDPGIRQSDARKEQTR